MRQRKTKYSNEVIKNQLLSENRSLELIGIFEQIKKDTQWKCKICNFIWNATWDNISRGKGCPSCAGNIPLNNYKIDLRLKNRFIERLDEYCGKNYLKLRFKCVNCNYIWTATPANVLRGTGCPACAKNAKLTNQIIDNRIIDRSLIRLNNVINSVSKIKWQCKECGYIWKALIQSVTQRNTGCPHCSIRKNEKLLSNIFKTIGFEVRNQFSINKIDKNCKRLVVDFYLPNNNLIIEYNGKQHYQPVQFGNLSKRQAEINLLKQQERDVYLRIFCKNNSINLLEIDGRIYQGECLEKLILSTFKDFIK